jgi:4a-hydroxytetrahydrobiopterin dehydratase
MALADERIEEKGAIKLGWEQIAEFEGQLSGWNVINDGGMEKLEKAYSFPDFAKALEFVNALGEVAESNGHHPQITFTWGAATVRWWSHSLGGLSLNDFIMAAKTDRPV